MKYWQIPEFLKQYPRFIVWKYDHREGEAKPTKKPVSPMTGAGITATDPTNHMTYDRAESAAKRMDFVDGVGFALMPEDDVFCVDLDSCADPGGDWLPWAKDICKMFPGACVEISQSGKGLHVWALANCDFDHRTRTNAVPGLEIYTKRRFIAIGHSCVGQGDVDLTDELIALIRANFPAAETTGGEATEWRDRPVPAWSGPADDQTLLELMFARSSARGKFDMAATPRQLWEGDETTLARYFPPKSDNQTFGRSEADMALAWWLAVYTGCDCERMDRLFRRSGLFRHEKWDRGDYGRNTILKACASAEGCVLTERKDKKPGDETRGEEFVHEDELEEYFRGCVYIRDRHVILCPDGDTLSREQFDAAYGRHRFPMFRDKQTPSAWECFLQNSFYEMPWAHTSIFRPEYGFGKIIDLDGRRAVNTFLPIGVEREEGDVSLFIDLISKLLPNERDQKILLSYCAAAVQNPGVKFQWCVVLQGCEGNGKSTIAECVGRALGSHMTYKPRADKLSGQFNSWIQEKLWIIVEEVRFRGRRDAMDVLKPMITDDRIELEGKGANQVMIDNRSNFFMCTNYKDAILKSEDDRRYCIFYTAQQSKLDKKLWGMTDEYWGKWRKWYYGGGFRAVNHFLKTWAIPEEFNPAKNCTTAPGTSAQEEVLYSSRDPISQEIVTAIEDELPGFRGGWVSSAAVNQLLERKNMRVSPYRRKELMEHLGYIPHPSGQRAPAIPQEENRRAYLWCRAGTGLESIPDPARAYMEAQGYVAPDTLSVMSRR